MKRQNIFVQERGGKILQNVDTAKKPRNTLSKVVGGQAVTETEVLNKSQTHKHKQSNKRSKDAKKENINPTPSVSGCAKKPKVIRTVTESESSEDEITDSEKCIVCKKCSPDLSKRPYIAQLSELSEGGTTSCAPSAHPISMHIKLNKFCKYVQNMFTIKQFITV
ncbi:hypothetical protein DPMN_042745 [Dreissena polymorpha]|uniref:Uncharacterized protein n=1 Tax=Dreissena polymorpha TaxID=45954 RepID=A0A9D4D122_DREPO|nr:hypothetical protein DPMN_042745 [Dreissena polymorpha]